MSDIMLRLLDEMEQCRCELQMRLLIWPRSQFAAGLRESIEVKARLFERLRAKESGHGQPTPAA